MKEYFKLQYRLTNRRIKDTGIEPILVYVILAFGFFWLSVYLFQKTEFAVYIYLLSVLTFTGRLSDARRTEFLKLCFGDTKLKKIRILENLTCSLPFIAFILYKQLFLYSLLLIVLTTVFALLDFRTKLNFAIWTPFSKRPFEFSTGFRNTFYLIFSAYALTWIAVFVNNFNLGVFSELLVFVTTLSYYTKPEDEYYVWNYSQNPQRFLFGKISTAILFSSLLALPVAFVLSVFFYPNIALVLLFFAIGWAFLIAIIVCKYSAYPAEMSLPHGILLALSLWFPPILIILIPYLFLQSEKQLSRLL